MLVATDRLQVVLYTSSLRFEGELHVIAGSRLTDALNNKTKDFLAMTDTAVYRFDGDSPIYRAAFLTVHRDQVEAILPREGLAT